MLERFLDCHTATLPHWLTDWHMQQYFNPVVRMRMQGNNI